jgi:hypothetical protein
MACSKKRNLAECNCTYEPCPRKGTCCECVRFHHEMRELPACVFDTRAERTFDRSFEHFAALVGEGRL